MHQGPRDPNTWLMANLPALDPAAVDRVFAASVSRLRQKSCSLLRKKPPMAKASKAPVVESTPESQLIDRFPKLKAKSKAVFTEVNEIEEQLLNMLDAQPENKLVLPDGRPITRKDNFANSNTFFKPAATKRFEVQVGAAPICQA